MALTVIDFSQSYATWVAGDGADLAGADMTSSTTSPRPWTWANLVESYILAAYPFHRGAALSVWARASNTEGALTNIAAATTGHVLRRSGTALAFGTLEAGAFATGPGIITAAMLDNGAARSVLGRSANTSGARADIAGAGAGSVLSDDGSTVAFRGINAAGGVQVLDRTATDLQVSNIALTTIYTYAIPASTVTAGRTLRLRWNGHFFNNDGANRSITLALVLGGVTIWQEGSATQTVSASRRWLSIAADISVQTNTLQIANIQVFLGTALATTTGVGDLGANAQLFGGGESIDSTVDISAGQTLTLQVAIGPAITSSANVYVRRRGAYLEMI